MTIPVSSSSIIITGCGCGCGCSVTTGSAGFGGCTATVRSMTNILFIVERRGCITHFGQHLGFQIFPRLRHLSQMTLLFRFGISAAQYAKHFAAVAYRRIFHGRHAIFPCQSLGSNGYAVCRTIIGFDILFQRSRTLRCQSRIELRITVRRRIARDRSGRNMHQRIGRTADKTAHIGELHRVVGESSSRYSTD